MIDKIEYVLNRHAVLLSSSMRLHEVILAESSPAPGLKSVKITNLPANALVFTFDGSASGLSNQFLNGTAPGINKGCDAVIVYEENEELCALFCEMKSFDSSPRQYERQLLNAEIFLEYLCRLVSSVENTYISVRRKRYVLFHLEPFVRGQRSKIAFARIPAYAGE